MGTEWPRIRLSSVFLGALVLGACNGQLLPVEEGPAREGKDGGGIDRGDASIWLDAARPQDPQADAGLSFDAALEAGAHCGDEQCSALESAQTCPADCGGVCGDEECSEGESACFCPADCGATTCGDGCCGAGEDACTCAADCGATSCGDGCCGATEGTADCPGDCGAMCGDDACNGNESSENCADDCGASCGDDVCNGGETACNCVADCGPTNCGDGCCGGGESSTSCSADCGAMCGDGACNGGESAANCPVDCGSVCGDGACNGDESACNCLADCGATTCGDGCCGASEDACGCPADCGATTCGDGCCAAGNEDTMSCPVDCGSDCGDGVCNGGESTADCPDDCGSQCGDGACNGGENACGCAADCGATTCGDDCCGGGESTATCADDCGSKCGDGACNGGESTTDCVADCGSKCGDGACNGDETPCDCASDCGGPACGDGYCCAASGENICNCSGDCTASSCGDGCCTGTESNATCAADCEPDPVLGLADRIDKTSLSAPAGVKAGVSNYRVWSYQSLRVAPVFTVPLANCQTLVGYTTDEGGSLKPRVSRLDANDQVTNTYTLTQGRELRGLAAEPDGHFGALLWSNSTDKIYVHRYSADGAQVWSEELTNASNTPDDFNIGDSRLDFGNGRYGAYYHVHSDSGHEGDTLKWVTTAGAESTGWAWGCSHMMSALIRYNPAITKFLPACVTDCYPGTSGSNFASDSIGGIYLNHRTTKVMDVDAGCNGKVAGELGSAALSPSGWKLVFNAHQNPAAKGQSSYNTSTMNQDIGFSSVNSSLGATSPVWLTNTADVDEADASIVRWQPSGDGREQYLVGWSEDGASAYKLATVSATGALLDGPVDVSATVQWGRRDDPMRRHRNGDVVWSWFDAAGDSQFYFARVKAGPACIP